MYKPIFICAECEGDFTICPHDRDVHISYQPDFGTVPGRYIKKQNQVGIPLVLMMEGRDETP